MTRLSRLAVLLILAGMAAAQPTPQNANSPASVGELFASDAAVRGPLLLVGGGIEVASGATLEAGKTPAVLKLRRGGEVRVCAGTTVTISSSPSGRDLMLALNRGAIQTQYRVGASSDYVLTPDFRLALIGPGEFHFAIGADNGGNTCLRALEGNTAAIIATEVMGDSAYQVKPREQVFFRQGKLAEPSIEEAASCGCPGPAPVQFARSGAASPERSEPLPEARTGETQVSIEAPIVFNAEDLPEPAAMPQSALDFDESDEIFQLSALAQREGFSSLPNLRLAPEVVPPPPAAVRTGTATLPRTQLRPSHLPSPPLPPPTVTASEVAAIPRQPGLRKLVVEPRPQPVRRDVALSGGGLKPPEPLPPAFEPTRTQTATIPRSSLQPTPIPPSPAARRTQVSSLPQPQMAATLSQPPAPVASSPVVRADLRSPSALLNPDVVAPSPRAGRREIAEIPLSGRVDPSSFSAPPRPQVDRSGVASLPRPGSGVLPVQPSPRGTVREVAHLPQLDVRVTPPAAATQPESVPQPEMVRTSAAQAATPQLAARSINVPGVTEVKIVLPAAGELPVPPELALESSATVPQAPSPAKPRKKSFLGRLGSAFASIFKG